MTKLYNDDDDVDVGLQGDKIQNPRSGEIYRGD